jgi:hypothetical protein
LNDGSIDFKNQPHIEALAFGHCDYAYRNLGRLTTLQIRQDSRGFEVKVDDKTCFLSEKVNNFPPYTVPFEKPTQRTLDPPPLRKLLRHNSRLIRQPRLLRSIQIHPFHHPRHCPRRTPPKSTSTTTTSSATSRRPTSSSSDYGHPICRTAPQSTRVRLPTH